jgi:hypothetical protein
MATLDPVSVPRTVLAEGCSSCGRKDDRVCSRGKVVQKEERKGDEGGGEEEGEIYTEK